MSRKTKEELSSICNEYKIDKLWSWSRYHCYKQDRWEYFLKYIQHKVEDRPDSIYGVSGGNVHDIIEGLYINKIKYEEMIDKYEDSLFVMNCADLKYNRSDSEKNELIANKYENCIRHFFKTHNKINWPCITEKFIIIKISNSIYMQGYVDMLFVEKIKDENKNIKQVIHIEDWKTSTRYQGKKIDEECGQLVLYAEGVSKALNIPIDDIIAEWNFVKYVTVSIEQKNGKIRTTHLERHKIGEGLINSAKMWLKEFGYEEKLDEYVDKMILDNSIESLPDKVKQKFTIEDCYIRVPLNLEKIKQLKDDIIKTIEDINEKEEQFNESDDENVFWQEVTDKDEFRISTLSGYSRKLHKPYDEYLKEKELFVSDDNFKDGNACVSENDELFDFISLL